ncbi:hypothetical protein CCR75_006716 [Bremia lactucae]|uniref:Uncharacterized protein n=1 Tax=Bremia lactucae TaxID=4779 RepID=A0A976IB52_BRELC|nr:hypothetical protein CCR75_006716 [Bremia lactucae]
MTEEVESITAALSLSNPSARIDVLDKVRQSVLSGNVKEFLTAVGDIGDKSPLVYLMDWLHIWQQEYEAFVQVLDADEESMRHFAPTVAKQYMNEIEAEATRLLKGFRTITAVLIQQLGISNVDSVIDRHGWTLLMQAANLGLSEMTQELVTSKANVNYCGTSEDDLNPLYLAIESEHTDVALLLLQRGAIESSTKVVKHSAIEKDDGSEDVCIIEEDCALFQACRFGLVNVVKEMLALGVDVNFALPSTGDRALHVAVMSDRKDVVELLVNWGKIDVNALNKSGQTCLFGCSDVELVKLLVILSSVDPNIKDVDCETALSIAQALGDESVVEYLATVTHL